jgi:hypothetical protein
MSRVNQGPASSLRLRQEYKPSAPATAADRKRRNMYALNCKSASGPADLL